MISVGVLILAAFIISTLLTRRQVFRLKTPTLSATNGWLPRVHEEIRQSVGFRFKDSLIDSIIGGLRQEQSTIRLNYCCEKGGSFWTNGVLRLTYYVRHNTIHYMIYDQIICLSRYGKAFQ